MRVKITMNKLKLTLLLITATLLLTACQDKEAGKLDNRVVTYWNYKINKDFNNAYKFLSPGWKKNESESQYNQRLMDSKVDWISVKLIDKKCKQNNLCQVNLAIEYEYSFRGSFGDKIKVPSTVAENWIMKDNVWYNVPVEKKLR